MDQSGIDNYFFSLPEPESGCLLFLRNFLLDFSKKIHEERKFNTPFYYYNKKWLCFISYNPKTKEIYVSFVNGNKIRHPKLFSEGRKKMKIFRVNAQEDVDVKSLGEILKLALELAE